MSAAEISATTQATARRRMTAPSTSSRCRALSSLLSRRSGCRKRGGSTTAAATSGPAYDPRPTSSMPQRRKLRGSSTPKVSRR